MATKTETIGAGLPEGVGHGKSFPPLDVTTFAPQLVWLAIAFALLYALLSRLALPRIGQLMEERRERVQRDLNEAERLRGETDQALKAYEQSHAEARSRAQSIANEMRDKLAKQAEAERHRLDAELAAKIGETEKQIAETKAKALAGVDQIAAETANAIVAKLIGQEATPDEVRRALAPQAAE